MPVIDYIDGVNRDIYLHSDTVGSTVHPIDIYKEMRVIRRTDETLRNFDVFLTAKGKDEKGGGTYTERYVVCNLGARIIPYDTSHTLTINGTIITDDGQSGVACFDRSPLNPATVVDINYVPPQVEVIVISGGSALTQEEHDMLYRLKHMERAVYVNTESLVNGDGGQDAPFNNQQDAADYAEDNGITTLIVLADIPLDRQFKNFTVRGIGHPTVNTNNQDLEKTEFYHCKLEGAYTGAIKAFECVLLNGFLLNGGFNTCGTMQTLTTLNGGSVILNDPFNAHAGLYHTEISMNSGGVTNLTMHGADGRYTISDCDNVLDIVSVSMVAGHLIFDDTCVAGDMIALGDCEFEDFATTAGANVINRTSPKVITEKVWAHSKAILLSDTTALLMAYTKNKRALVKTGSVWQLIIYDTDNSTPILSKDLKDINNDDITDIAAGTLAIELMNTI